MPRRRRAPLADGANPAVSIVLAVFDPPVGALVEQLDAIASQTSPDWECIVVDDASRNPDVVAIIDRWVRHDPRRRLVRRDDNGGIAAATNDGLEAAAGEFVTICDHDDLVAPDAVEAFVDHFRRHPDHAVAYSDEVLVDADGAHVFDYDKPDYSARRHLGQHYLAHLVAARRTAIGDIRVRSSFEPSQDYDFWLRVIEASSTGTTGDHVGHIARPLYSWRAIAGSSALDAAEKPEMCEAVRRCSQDALDRRGIVRRAVTVEHDGRPTTSVRLQFPDDADAPGVDVIRFAPDDDPTTLNRRVRATNADVVCFVPEGADFDPSELAREASSPGVGAIGPTVVDRSGRVASVGRVLTPDLHDPFRGVSPDATGPWGAFFVVREVSAIALAGLTVERAAFESAGGLAADVSLDLASAELCLALAADGDATLVHPGVVLVHDLVEPDPAHEDAAHGRARHPQRWVERYDPRGVARLAWTQADEWSRLRDAIRTGSVDLVTSDVFDTVVTRPVATPSDLFVRLADRVELPRHVSAAVFAAARIDAEARARRRRHDDRRRALLDADPHLSDVELGADPVVSAPEVTLEEIWDLMPTAWGDPSEMLDAELSLEADALVPIAEAISTFALARAHDVPVELVSDTYLSASQLRTVLEGAGVDLSSIDAVTTSSDHLLGKTHGLLQKVVERRGVDAARVAHVGDNEMADAHTASELGLQSFHVDVPHGERHVANPSPHLARWSAATGTDLGITSAIRATLVAGGRSGLDPSFQYGAAVVGPVLAGFAHWVAQSTAALGADHVHCMLREGATIADLLHTCAPDGPTPVPIHVSRWVTMRAAVVEATPDELFTALARRADLDVDHVVDAFGCDPALVRGVIGSEPIAPSSVPAACAALAADERVRRQIVAGAADLRERVLAYLRRRLVTTPDRPLVVADVGWGGTIQEGLQRIARVGGLDIEIVGLYLALSGAGEERRAKGARMSSYLPDRFDDGRASEHSRIVAHHADTIERIMTPRLGTLVDIGPDAEPICRDVDDEPVVPTLMAARRAMFDVVTRLATSRDDVDDVDDQRWLDPQLRAEFARTMSDAVTTPDRAMALALGAWPHDDVAGTTHRAIAGADLAEAIGHSSIADVARLDPNGRKWVAGLAAVHNPALSAAIDATRFGVETDALMPPGELGTARIVTFALGSEDADGYVTHRPHTTAGGWSSVTASIEVASLRAVLFDPGEFAGIVEIDRFLVRPTDRDGVRHPRRDVHLDDADVAVAGGRILDGRRVAIDSGGHVLVHVESPFAGEIRQVEVTVAFRAWRLDDDHPLLDPSATQRVRDTALDLVSRVRRRL